MCEEGVTSRGGGRFPRDSAKGWSSNAKKEALEMVLGVLRGSEIGSGQRGEKRSSEGGMKLLNYFRDKITRN